MRVGEPRIVASSDWVASLADLKADGYGYLDLLAAIDRIDHREVVVHVVDPTGGRRVMVSTSVPADDPCLPSIGALFPAAVWHEREAAEMLGVVFEGHPDPRALLLHAHEGPPPLLASTALDERVSRAWPAQDRSSRRRTSSPGVRDQWFVAEPG